MRAKTGIKKEELFSSPFLLQLPTLCRHVGWGNFLGFFHRQLDTAALIDVEYFYFDLLTFFQIVGHTLHALVRDLRNVDQTVFARQDRDEGAEINDTC